MKRFGREIALLTLPVLIFGGVALWKTRGGSMASLQGAPSDIYSGKPRLEIGEIKPLKMTPYDVSQGFVWGVDAQFWQGGVSPVAPSVKRSVFMGSDQITEVFYRRGTRWSKAFSSAPSDFITQKFVDDRYFGNFAVGREMQIKANLSNVPRDAEEIRLRGYFTIKNSYPNGVCRGASAGAGWESYLGICVFTTQSKPFDIPIAMQKQTWPNPEVSHEPAYDFVDAKLLIDSGRASLFLQIRRKDRRDLDQQTFFTIRNTQLLDANQKPVNLFKRGTTESSDQIHDIYGNDDYDTFSSKRAKSDYFLRVLTPDNVPEGGWANVKFPLTYRAEISDVTCWPLKIDTKVERMQMKTEDFGGAK